MVFEHIEKLKNEYTDKYVIVKEGYPELCRFQGMTGTVRTVNMNGRALVEFDAYNNIGWYGMVAPAGTPADVIAKLNAAGNAAAQTAEVQEALGNMGISPVQITPEDYAAQIEDNLAIFTKLVEDGAVEFAQ